MVDAYRCDSCGGYWEGDEYAYLRERIKPDVEYPEDYEPELFDLCKDCFEVAIEALQ